MHLFSGIFLLCFSMQLTVFVESSRISGPFEVEVTELAQCEDGGTNQIVFPTKMYKRRDLPSYYNGTITIGVPFDDKMSIHVELTAWGNQGYRRRFVEHTLKGCREIMKFDGGFLKRIYASGGVNVKKCPLPTGDLHLNGVDAYIKPGVKVFPYNKYKTYFTFFYDNTKVGCYIIFTTVTPIEIK